MRKIISIYIDKAGLALETVQWQIGVGLMLVILQSVLSPNAWIVSGSIIAWVMFLWGMKKCKARPKQYFIFTALFIIMLLFCLWANATAKKEKNGSDLDKKEVVTQAEAITSENLIKNGGFEEGYDGLNWWGHFEYGKEIHKPYNSATRETLVAYGSNKRVNRIISVADRIGQNGTRCLLINNPTDSKPDKYHQIYQVIDNLKPNALYRVSFALYIENSEYNSDSLYITLGSPWQIEEDEEGKVFSKNIHHNGWTNHSIVLKNHSEKSALFRIVVVNIALNIKLDNFKIEEVKDEQR